MSGEWFIHSVRELVRGRTHASIWPNHTDMDTSFHHTLLLWRIVSGVLHSPNPTFPAPGGIRRDASDSVSVTALELSIHPVCFSKHIHPNPS